MHKLMYMSEYEKYEIIMNLDDILLLLFIYNNILIFNFCFISAAWPKNCYVTIVLFSLRLL
jgi:hypothetical protein